MLNDTEARITSQSDTKPAIRTESDENLLSKFTDCVRFELPEIMKDEQRKREFFHGVMSLLQTSISNPIATSLISSFDALALTLL